MGKSRLTNGTFVRVLIKTLICLGFKRSKRDKSQYWPYNGKERTHRMLLLCVAPLPLSLLHAVKNRV